VGLARHDPEAFYFPTFASIGLGSTDGERKTMSLELDRKSTALVVIDLQKGIVSTGRALAPYSSDVVVRNAVKLVAVFRENGMPVFLVHVLSSPAERLNVVADDPGWRSSAPPPPDASDFVAELAPKEGDVTITKKQWGAFYGTDLELQLRRRGMKTIVLCGVSTNYGVESTARFAYEYGFQQVFAEDAMASASAEMHRASINFILKRIGQVRKTDEILKALH
jgi:nicotinamidase-related amidase